MARVRLGSSLSGTKELSATRDDVLSRDDLTRTPGSLYNATLRLEGSETQFRECSRDPWVFAMLAICPGILIQ